MSYVAIVEDMPQELQFPMLKLLDALQHDMREQLAVRREDIDELRDAVKQLAVAQERTEQRVSELAVAQRRTEQRVEELAEAQKGSEIRLTRLEIAVKELTEAQKGSEVRLTRLEIAVQELVEAQGRTQEQVRKMDDKMGRLIGSDLEARYRNKAYAYFGSLLRKTQVVDLQDMEPTLESALSDAEMADVVLLDLLIRGQLAKDAQRPEVYLALEISAVVDRGDVTRAVRRAELLRKAGYLAVPAVAGDDVTEGGFEAAQTANVFLVQDGRKDFWDEALAAVVAA